MTITAKVILDSVAPNGVRLTTFELTYPRFIHAELMTHRVFSRNAASSRAVPTKKKIERIREDMATPSEWGVNQKGMQSGGAIDVVSAEWAKATWAAAGESALLHAEILCGLRCARCTKEVVKDIPGRVKTDQECRCDESLQLDLHKQVANRIIEPWDHITVVLSATSLNNHWKLRLETDSATGRPMADPTYFELATKWKEAFDQSKPSPLSSWHMPYVTLEDIEPAKVYIAKLLEQGSSVYYDQLDSVLRKVSVGRCARVSYMRQGQGDIEDNLVLHDRLASSGHWSPFEHVAQPIVGVQFSKAERKWDCRFCGRGVAKDESCAVLNMDVLNPGRTPDPSCYIKAQASQISEFFVCKRCGLGHVTSGNFIGWYQYRKEFPNEAGGD